MSYLLRSLDTTLAKSMLFLPTAREIQKDMEDRYSVTSGPQFYGLQQNICEISQGDSSIADFFTKCKVDTEYWDRLSQSALQRIYEW